MSYVFAITKCIPKMDMEQAFIRLKKLRDTYSFEKSQELIDLINVIQHIYPCISSRRYDDEDDDFEWIWADGPLEGNIKGNVWTFSLIPDGLDEPLEFIIKKTNQLGFSVFSYEFEKIWWAGD